MPNWVSNSLSVTGEISAVRAFHDKATKPHPVGADEHGVVEYSAEPEFSFWNFVAPPMSAVESGEYFGTHGWSEGKEVGHTANNWYEWNNSNWNTKWDACEVWSEGVEEYETIPNLGGVSYGFETAWSIPYPVLVAMTEQHPDLHFSMECMEEQGWGAEYEGDAGEVIETRSWDIPNSHTDWVNIDREDSCVCSWSDDPDDVYGDCPIDRDGHDNEIVAFDPEPVTRKQMLEKFDNELSKDVPTTMA